MVGGMGEMFCSVLVLILLRSVFFICYVLASRKENVLVENKI